MSATSSTAPASAGAALAGTRSGVPGRSTASVRVPYRRQTAALMVGTTVVGLWLGLAAPAVSPVAAPVPTSAAAGDTAGGTGSGPTHHGHHR